MAARPDIGFFISPLVVLLGLLVMGLFIAAIAGRGRTRSVALGVLVFAIIAGLLFVFGIQVLQPPAVTVTQTAIRSPGPIAEPPTAPVPPAAPVNMVQTHPRLAVGPIGILALIVVVGAIAVAARRKSGTAGAVVKVIGIVLLILLLPVALWLVVRVVDVRHTESSYVVPAIPEAALEQAARPEPIWDPAVTEEFEADVYPSRKAAMEELARRFDHAGARFGDDWRQQTVYIDENPLNPELIHAFGRALKEHHDINSLIRVGGDANPYASGLVLDFEYADLQNRTAPWDSDYVQSSGRIEMTLSDGGKAVTINESFTEKPWLETPAQFRDSHPGRRFAIARSGEVSGTEQEARRQAMSRASMKVAEILDQVRRDMDGPFVPSGFTVTYEDMKGYGILMDTFGQEFAGSVGPIWRYAVLLDVSQDKVYPLAQLKLGMARARMVTWAELLVKLVGMAVLIAVVYAFLNAATRGYYVWSLRIAAVLLLGAGILLVLLLA